MFFGAVPTHEAVGAVLAHSIQFGRTKLRKGRCLSAEDIAAISEAGIAELTVARLDEGDMDEDAAASAVAAALVSGGEAGGFSVSAPFTGRVNLFAEAPGVVRIDAAAVAALNAVDPAITLATLPDFARVQARQMVATVKIIPYGIEAVKVARAANVLGASSLRLHRFGAMRGSLILTRTPGFKETLLAKGAEAVLARLGALGVELAETPVTVAHESAAVAGALGRVQGDLVLVLGASATSDAADTCPAGLVAAGGRLVRFGMPVDPGNLLFLGDLGGRHVVGLPGCARSPALNGADWVLERLVAGLPVDDGAIAAMGVGGLLKEIPQRPQPRVGRVTARVPARPRVTALVLAAGASRRMRGRDKLMEPVAGVPVLRRVVEAALASRADRVLVVLPPDAQARRGALAGSAAEIVVAQDAAEGMAASLGAGMRALGEATDAVVILLADMPETEAAGIDRLIAAFDPEERREICRAVAEDGTPGHPVLFGRRFFEALAGLSGDRGARDVVTASPEFIADVAMAGRAPLVDLDTPEDWAAWRAAQDQL